MTDEEGLIRLKLHSRCVLTCIFSFFLSGIFCLILVGGTFTTSPEVLNKMHPDRYYIIGAAILTPIFYIMGWVMCILGRRFGKMNICLIISSISIVPFLGYYLIWGLGACIAMIKS